MTLDEIPMWNITGFETNDTIDGITIINASETLNYYSSLVNESNQTNWTNWIYEDPEAYLDNYCQGFDGFVVTFPVRSTTKAVVQEICFHLRYD